MFAQQWKQFILRYSDQACGTHGDYRMGMEWLGGEDDVAPYEAVGTEVGHSEHLPLFGNPFYDTGSLQQYLDAIAAVLFPM